jgi:hypothetical protein
MSVGTKRAKKRLPFELRPTNIAGVYSFVPPPKGLDLTTASRRTQIRHGVLVPRPDPELAPDRFAVWNKVVGEIWNEKNFVAPLLKRSDLVPSLLHNFQRTDSGMLQDSNWSGCVIEGPWVGAIGQVPWSGAMGVWTVPSVSQPSTPPAKDGGWHSASWVGLDGFNNVTPDVLQAGVAQNVDSNGQPHYFAWIEWFVPNWKQYINQYRYVFPLEIQTVTVNAGDTVSVVVQYVQHSGDNIGNPLPPPGPYHFGAISFVNLTNGQSTQFYLDPPPGSSFQGESAEWIMELPGADGSLPKFDPINFQTAGACNAQNSPSLLWKDGQLISLVDAQQITETTESAGAGSVTINYNL